jgi:hypothetical protein
VVREGVEFEAGAWVWFRVGFGVRFKLRVGAANGVRAGVWIGVEVGEKVVFGVDGVMIGVVVTRFDRLAPPFKKATWSKLFSEILFEV